MKNVSKKGSLAQSFPVFILQKNMVKCLPMKNRTQQHQQSQNYEKIWKIIDFQFEKSGFKVKCYFFGLEISEIQTSRIIIKGLEIAAISIKLPEIGEEGSLVKPIHKGFCYWLDIGVRWAHLFLNFRRFKDTLGSFGLIVKVNFSLPRQSVGQSVVLHNKLGGGLANLEPVGRPIYGHAVFNNKLNQLFSLLDGTSRTLLVMTVWDFLSSPSLLYDSSTSLRDISFIYYKQLIFKKIKATTQRSTLQGILHTFFGRFIRNALLLTGLLIISSLMILKSQKFVLFLKFIKMSCLFFEHRSCPSIEFLPLFSTFLRQKNKFFGKGSKQYGPYLFNKKRKCLKNRFPVIFGEQAGERRLK